MGDRGKDMGDMRAIRAKMAAKYDNDVEAEIRGWFKNMINVDIEAGSFNLQRQLKTGQDLVKMMQEILSRTSNPPEACNSLNLKENTMNVAFKQMDNIDKFLKAAEAYGVPKGSLFQTPDLFEGRNMAQVLSTLVQLGTEAQRNNMNGPFIGPRPSESNYRIFSEEQLRQGKGIISLQAGTNKCASQKGMAMGTVRHVSDIRVEELDRQGQASVGGQSGWNQGASQSGMSFGAMRHGADIDAGDASQESQAMVGGQAGWNEGESQAGMSFGAVRHGADLDAGEASLDGQAVIGGQAGWNEGESQAGMSFGSVRHAGDIDAGDASMESQGYVGGQAGWNEGATQEGMSFGSMRHGADDAPLESQATIQLAS